MPVITEARDFRLFCESLELDRRRWERVQEQLVTLERVLNIDYWDSAVSRGKRLLANGSFARRTCIDTTSLELLALLPGVVYHRCRRSGEAAEELCRTLKQRGYLTECDSDGRTVHIGEARSIGFRILPTLITSSGSYICPTVCERGENAESWELVYGLAENEAFERRDLECGGNLRVLCQMARAWDEEMDVGIGGRMLDTIVYHFMGGYKERCCLETYYDRLCLDFFAYMLEQSRRRYWSTLAGKRRLYRRVDFREAAQRAHELVVEAVDAYWREQPVRWYHCWKRVFGSRFPDRF